MHKETQQNSGVCCSRKILLYMWYKPRKEDAKTRMAKIVTRVLYKFKWAFNLPKCSKHYIINTTFSSNVLHPSWWIVDYIQCSNCFIFTWKNKHCVLTFERALDLFIYPASNHTLAYQILLKENNQWFRKIYSKTLWIPRTLILAEKKSIIFLNW